MFKHVIQVKIILQFALVFAYALSNTARALDSSNSEGSAIKKVSEALNVATQTGNLAGLEDLTANLSKDDKEQVLELLVSKLDSLKLKLTELEASVQNGQIGWNSRTAIKIVELGTSLTAIYNGVKGTKALWRWSKGAWTLRDSNAEANDKLSKNERDSFLRKQRVYQDRMLKFGSITAALFVVAAGLQYVGDQMDADEIVETVTSSEEKHKLRLEINKIITLCESLKLELQENSNL